MKEIVYVTLVVLLAVSLATVINIRGSERLKWLERIDRMNEEGLEWEASHNTYNRFSINTENLQEDKVTSR